MGQPFFEVHYIFVAHVWSKLCEKIVLSIQTTQGFVNKIYFMLYFRTFLGGVIGSQTLGSILFYWFGALFFSQN
jgi:hypothetical protein